MKIEINIDGLEPIIAEIADSGSETVIAMKESLPFDSSVNRWGDEIYFYVPFDASLEDGARSEMKVGEIAFWPQGPALAIFFGPTPMSKGDDPMAASDCNVIGTVNAKPEEMRAAKEGAKIRVTLSSA